MYILSNMWFQSLMRQFFFNIDKVIFSLISKIYDLLIVIAETSPISQADISDISGRIYKLLAIFMIFKVTFSLIMYVVNPDDFTEKSKGISKLTINIVLSLALLILTPFIFNYAYQLQKIVLEDNSLSALIFGDEKADESIFNTAGDKMAYIALSPFFTPDTSIDNIKNCQVLLLDEGEINEDCFGLDSEDPSEVIATDDTNDNLYALTRKNNYFSETTLINYATGLKSKNADMIFRSDLVLATNSSNEYFIMDYSYLCTTAVGVCIVLLLITYCMDIGVRSIKLAFLQLIAPIPIISYVDPKSGKDGLFKKWYKMCFSTYISLFVRLLVIYFAVYIISRLGDGKLVNIIDGSYVTNALVCLFILIGALMFAKQFPKILEGLGIKLDGGGKFTLNPLKKMENDMVGGKRVLGTVGGLAAGAFRGNPLSGAIRGFGSNGGLRGGFYKQADINRKMGEARMNGAGFLKSRAWGLISAAGMENMDLESKFRKLNKDKHSLDVAKRGLDDKIKDKENRKKELQDKIAPDEFISKRKKSVSDKGKQLVDFSKNEITGGKAEVISAKAKYLHNVHDYLSQNQNQRLKKGQTITYYKKNGSKLVPITLNEGDLITPEIAAAADEAIGFYENKVGAMEHLEVRLQGDKGYKPKMSGSDFERDADGDIVFEAMNNTEKDAYAAAHADFSAMYVDYARTTEANGEKVEVSAKSIKAQSDKLSSESITIMADHAEDQAEIAKLDKGISEIRTKEKIELDGDEMSIADAERILAEREKKYNDIRTSRKTNIEAHNNRRLGPPPK